MEAGKKLAAEIAFPVHGCMNLNVMLSSPVLRASYLPSSAFSHIHSAFSTYFSFVSRVSRFLIPAIFIFMLAGCHSAPRAVGSKKFTESYVLGDIAQMLLGDEGLKYQHRQGMGGTIVLWQALKKGDIALYPEYTGTIGEEILKRSGLDSAQMQVELQKQGVGMTGDLGFNDTYALVMRRERAAQFGIKTIGDLRAHPDLRAGPTPEFMQRKDGWKPLLQRYNLAFENVRGIEHELGYAALKSNEIDLKECYSTDAKIAQYDLVVLQDDLNFFPQYKAVFLYRLDTDPRAISAIRKLEGKLSDRRMTELNALAEKNGDYAGAAAAYFGGNRKSEGENLAATLRRLTFQHLQLVGISLLFAILAGIPLGILASRRGLLSQIILGVTGIIQTIPSLALLVFFIPLFGANATTAIIALFLYSLLPIVRNTAVGLQDIPGPVRESAAALGLEPTAQLRKVFLPIASPTILAGIKTSAIINVGTATLAGLIGAGGYGELIQSGLSLVNNTIILEGAIPAAILALLAQFGFDLLDRLLISKGLRLPHKQE